MKRLNYLLLFFCAFFLTMCQDGKNSEEENTIDPETQARDATYATTSLLSRMLQTTYSGYLEGGFQDDNAENRSSCPISVTFSDGVYPDTVFLKFDNCNPSFVYNQNFDGNLMFIQHGDLDDLTICPLVTMQNNPNFGDFVADVGNGPASVYTFSIDDPIEFCLASDNGQDLKYTYELTDDIVIKQPNGSLDLFTRYFGGMSGCATVKAIAGDDINDPNTLIDNRFCIGINPAKIKCNAIIRPGGNSAGIQNICIATDGDDISFEFICGCPDDGTLYIADYTGADCSTVIDAANAYDFGYNPAGIACDNDISGPNGQAMTFDCGI